MQTTGGDEFTKQGKKYLSKLLTMPYFKLSTADYCDFYDEEKSLDNVYEDALINSEKQKWTGKDIKELRETIRHVLIDTEIKKYQDRYFYLMTRLEYEKGRQQKSTNVNKKGQGKNNNSHVTIPQHLFTIDGGESSNGRINVTAQVSMKEKELKTWLLQNEARIRKLSYETLMKDPQFVNIIDWFKVAKKMTTETGKDRDANDCFLAWKHEGHSSVNTKRWNVAETKKLMDIVKNKKEAKTALFWDEVTMKLGNNRTSYQCFHKYRNQLVHTEMMNWNEEKTEQLGNFLHNEGSNWRKSVEALGDVRGTKHQMQERWKKTCNPILRHGPFTRVEDALLLLQIGKLQEFLKKERNFVVLISYLPWRFETVWRDRANHLFSNGIIPWTPEEDEKLIKLADSQSGRKDWQTIAKEFSSSFKNRKGCLTRYNILKRRIGTESSKSFRNIEEYHEAYSMFRYNVFQYKHLTEVLELLNRVMNEELSKEPFPGLRNDRPPDEWELRWMLLDYDRHIVQQTINKLTGFIQSKNDHWQNTRDQSGKINKTFDRRTFHRQNPKSVASALHIRDTIKLIPKDQIGRPLTPFENDVYIHYARFCRTKPLKKDAQRPYIPTAEELRKMVEVSGIIQHSKDDEKINELNNNSSIQYVRGIKSTAITEQVSSTILNGRKKRSHPAKQQQQETDLPTEPKKRDHKIFPAVEEEELVLKFQVKVKEQIKDEKMNKMKLGKVQEKKSRVESFTSPTAFSSSAANHEQVTEVMFKNSKVNNRDTTVSRRKRQQIKLPAKSCELPIVRKSPRISKL